ncbi:MAG: putative transcription elongation factor GreA [Candidatus Hodgkinia cicadicola]|nr:MAG: putative transcription elongation factor GreA [Candidatus Hodgkinia cicadicola]
MLNYAIAPITTAGYSNLFRQLNWREQHEKPRLKTQLRTTRALGDLSENADHHTAKEEDKRNENEINEIKTTLITTETMPLKGKKHRVQFNSIVILKEYKTNKHRTYCIIGEREIAKNKNSVSIASITAQALVNKKEGDVVVIPRLNSAKVYKIIYIKIW